MKNKILLLLPLLYLLKQSPVYAQYEEPYRPQFHFSPETGWIGDPVGLVHTDGKYHLFWWGHAISEDLVHWEELPYPMKGGDGSFSYFSGSVVVDKKNTAGFGKDSFIAAYTRHMPGDSLPETQAISVSNDEIYFHYYEENPVLDINEIFFRDPQVFWYEPEEKWVMVVSLPDIQKIHVYESRNMKDWEYLSQFGSMGAQSAFWECPDLFELPVEGQPGETKWVMLIGRGPNRVQYFLGSFDGKEFKADQETRAYLLEGKGLEGTVFSDFEGKDFEEWQVEGTAFGAMPVKDSLVSLGERYASSKASGKGSLRSAEFTIEQPAINFLIAGGNHPGGTSISLEVEGNPVRTSTADDSNTFKWKGWDVSDLKGKKARIKITDTVAEGAWSYIAIDHIMFSDILQNQELEHALWLDYGPDFYAARTWRDIDQVDDRTVILGWMGNWEYAREVPTSWGKGFQSLPREISIKRFQEGNRLVQKPVPELKKLRKELYQVSNRSVEGVEKITAALPSRNTYEIEAVFDTRTEASFGFNLLVGNGRKLVLSYNPTTASLSLDRTQTTNYTSNEEFVEKFATKMYAPVKEIDEQIRFHIMVDQASVEIFTRQGEKVFSASTFPGEEQRGIEVFSVGGASALIDFKMWELDSIWKKNVKNEQ